MCYPLLFPSGDPGCHCGMQQVAECQTARCTRLTMHQFYKYRLAVREEISPIHSAGKLFQQYAVDAYVKTKGCEPYYIRSNEIQLRAQLYYGLMDHLHNGAAEQGLPAGVHVILPYSFIHEPCSKNIKMPWLSLPSMESLISSSSTLAAPRQERSLPKSWWMVWIPPWPCGKSCQGTLGRAPDWHQRETCPWSSTGTRARDRIPETWFTTLPYADHRQRTMQAQKLQWNWQDDLYRNPSPSWRPWIVRVGEILHDPRRMWHRKPNLSVHGKWTVSGEFP